MDGRQNRSEEVRAEVVGVSQSLVSVAVQRLTPLIAIATIAERPSLEEASAVG